MAFTLRIDTDNAAFDENALAEVARILRSVADQIDYHAPLDFSGRCRDVNGNTVGEYRFTGGDA